MLGSALSSICAAASGHENQSEAVNALSPQKQPKAGRGSAESTDSRRAILDAAVELMSEYGYSGTSISMICRRAGLQASSTYWHFKSKEGLLAAVVEDGARRWMESLPRWSQLEGPPRERLRALLRAAAQGQANDPEPLRLLLLLSLERPDMDSESRNVIRDVRRRAASGFRLAFREIFSDTDSPQMIRLSDELADFALAVADGAFLAHQIDPSIDLAALFDRLATAFLLMGDDEAAKTVGADHQAELS